ncbi:MAG: hypothetical protein JKX75_00325 [Gammaproteobacteria bacterium]|nr:hypothetical protein [Gammaproteobacteria bacterium]
MPVNKPFFNSLVFLFVVSAPVIAENDIMDAAFLEFLADLENIDDSWTHPIDFDDTTTNSTDMITNNITATETENE